MLESKFQALLIDELQELFPDVMVLKNDSGYRQGFPDLTVLWRKRWAVLECKASESSPYQPNQEWYLDKLGLLSFSKTIYPENKDTVLKQLKSFFNA